MLFDESTLRKLNQLTLVASRVRAGAIKGERRSSRRGSSVEFADYRDYTPGDDLRRLDWNIYARLEKPFIKLLEEEEDLAVYILIDGSRSMDWGDGEQHKFSYARKLAAGLGAIALSSGDLLSVELLQGGRVSGEFGPTRGGYSLTRLFHFLETPEAGDRTDLNASLRDFSLTTRRPGLIVLLSDMFSPEGCDAGMHQLLGHGHEAALIHILSPDEIDPPFAGDLQLVDVETKHELDISGDGGLRRLYQKRVEAWIQSTRTNCRKQGIKYLNLSTDHPWDQAILLEMRRAGIVK